MLDGASVVESVWCGANEQSDQKKQQCERLHRGLKRIVKARAGLDAREIALLREANEIGLWREYGCSSLLDYMQRELGYTARAAAERLRVAAVMIEVPALELALTSGEISFSGVRELARVATPETVGPWMEATEGKTVREIEELVSGHQRGDLPSSSPDPALVLQVLRFEVKPATKARARAVEKLLAKHHGERLDHDGLMNALCAAVEQVIAGRADKDRDGDGDGHSDRARYQVAITRCEWCKRGWQDGGGLVAELTPPELDRALCDAQQIGSLDGNRIDRAKHDIPPATRRKVKRRDHGRCRVPGCRSTHNLDVHHILPLSKGGTHHVENLATLCEGHHLAVHSGTLVISGSHPSFTFTRTPQSSLGRESLIVDAKSALRNLGFAPHEVKAAIAGARTYAGEQELTLEQWIAAALGHCQRPAGSP